MLKYLLLASLTILSCFSGISYAEQHDFQKNEIDYVWQTEPNHSESKKVFLDAFIKCYDQISLDVLKKSSREDMVQWLDDTFEEAYANHQVSKNSLWISANENDRVVGFLNLDNTNYPEEIYLAFLAIDPDYQGKGIASTMIRCLFDQFSECRRFVVVTRRANEEANRLYHSIGFAPSAYLHEGYSEELYISYEYNNQ